jgi:hypothetical protein
VSGSAVFTISPSGANHLDGNLADLEPRGHLYITAGFTNLPVSLALHTTNLADGYHDLTAVAYEGSHVRTQCRATQNVRIANSALSATFTILAGGPYTDVASTMQFSVVANTNNISKIELFSTGGSLGSVSSQSSAIFSIPGATLGLGLHPVYALVTASNAKQYRTETKWIRLVGPEPPFSATVNRGPILSWSATAGRSYDILSVTNLTNSFQIRATLLPTNGTAQWAETNSSASQRFYRVRTSN